MKKHCICVKQRNNRIIYWWSLYQPSAQCDVLGGELTVLLFFFLTLFKQTHLWMKSAVEVCCFLILKLPGCGSHNSPRHRNLSPSYAIANTSTTWIYIAMEVEKNSTFRGVILADQNRPPINRPLSKSRPWRKKDGQIGGLLPSIKMTIVEWVMLWGVDAEITSMQCFKDASFTR